MALIEKQKLVAAVDRLGELRRILTPLQDEEKRLSDDLKETLGRGGHVKGKEYFVTIAAETRLCLDHGKVERFVEKTVGKKAFDKQMLRLKRMQKILKALVASASDPQVAQIERNDARKGKRSKKQK